MQRRQFLGGVASATLLSSLKPANAAPGSTTGTFKHPRAITMWEFSWIERRWPGAGFEDWDRALDELSERGYDAVRIDPFPHLLATDPTSIVSSFFPRSPSLFPSVARAASRWACRRGIARTRTIRG
jgi:hypothetical protein